MIKPFSEITGKKKILVIAGWFLLFFLLFEVVKSQVIPSPTKIGKAFLGLWMNREFYEDLLATLITTSKAMFYAIIITVLLCYSATIPLFRPIAEFVSKCRYLTLTGLVFVFTMMSSNISDLKMYLLLFGIVPFFTTSFLSVVSSIPEQEVFKGYVNGKGRWGTLWEVVIIGKMDILFEVMRQNFAISWMMITMVEGYAMADGGIGTMIIKSNKQLDMANVFAILITILLLGLGADIFLSRMRLILFPYLKTKK